MNPAHRPGVDLMSRGEKYTSGFVTALFPLVRRVTLLAALGLVALSSGCSRTQERPVNAWLTVRVRTPKSAGNGMIQLGPDARVWVLVKVNGSWRRLAEGRQVSVMRLKYDQAVLLALMHDRMHGEYLFLKEGDSAPIPITRFFPEEGMLSVPRSGAHLDWVQGKDGDFAKGFSRLGKRLKTTWWVISTPWFSTKRASLPRLSKPWTKTVKALR